MESHMQTCRLAEWFKQRVDLLFQFDLDSLVARLLRIMMIQGPFSIPVFQGRQAFHPVAGVEVVNGVFFPGLLPLLWNMDMTADHVVELAVESQVNGTFFKIADEFHRLFHPGFDQP